MGLSNTAVDFAIFSLLVYGLRTPVVFANLSAFAVAFLNSFVLNRRFTFADIAGDGGIARQAVRFLVVNLGALAISTTIVSLTSGLFTPIGAKLIAVGFTFAWTYLFSWFFVFRAPGSRRGQL